jgi:hypothetical protein
MLACMTSLPLTGGCLCGAVRYEVSAPFVTAGYCHCTRCQRRTGTAAAVSALVSPGTFTVTSGRRNIRDYDPGGGSNIKSFCVHCGSGLYAWHPDYPDRVAVRLGTVDGDPGIRPSYHQRVDTAAIWEALPDDGLPRYEGPAPANAR